jgi:hypothetical protein
MRWRFRGSRAGGPYYLQKRALILFTRPRKQGFFLETLGVEITFLTTDILKASFTAIPFFLAGPVILAHFTAIKLVLSFFLRHMGSPAFRAYYIMAAFRLQVFDVLTLISCPRVRTALS